MKTLDKIIKTTKRGLVEISLIGSLIFCGCASTLLYDNYKNPEEFAKKVKEYQMEESDSDIIATLGSVLGIMGDNEEQRALGIGLFTYGSLKSNKEAAEKSKAEINIIQEHNIALPDNTSVPEYNLKELENIYKSGHMVFVEKISLLWPQPPAIYEIDGLQYIFTCGKSIDLNFDGLDFNEFLNIRRNFKQGDELEICVGYRSRGIKVRNKEGGIILNRFVPEKTTTTINLKVYREKDNSIIEESTHNRDFLDYSKDEILSKKMDTSKLEPGLYLIEAKYSSDYDIEKDRGRNYNYYTKKEAFEGAVIKNLRQYFQILPNKSEK